MPFALLLVLLALFMGSCSQPAADSKSEKKKESQKSFKFDSASQSESEWLVRETCKDILGMAYFAKKNSHPDTNTFRCDVISQKGPSNDNFPFKVSWTFDSSAPNKEISLVINKFIWSPESYSPVIESAFNELQLQRPTTISSANETLLASLLDLEAEVIEKENQRVSALLSKDMLNPLLHEEAALILGGFAMREAAGCFNDPRNAICRMSSHLAFAKFLRANQPLGINGQFAELTLLTLAGRGQEAVDLLNQLKVKPDLSPTAKSWVTALLLRNTQDWRILSNSPQATLLEQLEYFRALCSSISTDRGIEFLKNYSPKMVPDWSRITLQNNFSVADGHLFCDSALQSEWTELSQIWQAIHQTQIPFDRAVEEMNKKASTCVFANEKGETEVRVIDWGLWASFFQRHLCHQIQAGIHFTRNIWGVPDVADNYEKIANAQYCQLTLYPIIQKRLSRTPEAYRLAMEKCLLLCKKQPELVDSSNWHCLNEKPDFAPLFKGMPSCNSWFRPLEPTGTTFDVDSRLWIAKGKPEGSISQLETLRKINPYNFSLLSGVLYTKYGEHPTKDQVLECYQTILDYNLAALIQALRNAKDDIETSKQLYQRACVLDPNCYIRYGDYLAEKNLDAEAAIAFEEALKQATNRVWLSNSLDWLVDYYYNHGRISEAVAAAEFAAEVYSHTGLETKAKLMERMENYDEAENIFKKIVERYDAKWALIGFYLRYQQKKGVNKCPDADSLIKALFPNGLEKVTLRDFSKPPTDGMIIKESNQNVKIAGLKPGDVIVALDGYRTRNLDQYTAIWAFTTDPKLHLIVWHGGKYIEAKPTLKDRRFGAKFESYKPK